MKTQKELEATDVEKASFLRFLNGNVSKIVELGKVLGIGGEGIVIRDTREIEEYKGKHEYQKFWSKKKYKNKEYKLEQRSRRAVAIKFVKFEKEDGEDLGTEKGYQERLWKLGDYNAATYLQNGYTRPYLDFGISEIIGSLYYVIGKQD